MADYILKHHGIKGQKWGVRRFQNPDGTRTAAGKKRYKTNALKEGAEYARATRNALNSNLSPEERKRARAERKEAIRRLDTERAKMRYNDALDRGVDPTRFRQGQVNRYMKKGMTRSEAELKAFRGKEAFQRGVRNGTIIIGISLTNPAIALPVSVGTSVALNVLDRRGHDKIYDRQLKKEM